MKKAFIAIFCPFCFVQTDMPMALGQVQNAGGAGGAGAGNSVTVQVTQTIDSSKSANGARFAGQVVNPVTTAQGATIQAGTAAVMTLTETTVGNMNTWSLALVSPVQGTVTSLGGTVGSMAGRLGGQLGGLNLPSFGKKNTTPPAQPANANTSTSTGGTRVYVPVNTQLRFSIAQAAGTTTSQSQGRPAGLAQTAGIQQPAGQAPGVPGTVAPQPSGFTNNNNPGGAPAGGLPGQAAGSNTVVWSNVQYVLQGCQRQAPHIVCTVQLTNMAGGDANLTAGRTSYYVDQSGNKVNINSATAANCNLLGGCLALSGLAMASEFVFMDQDAKSSNLVRFQIDAKGGPVQFTNVPVK